MENITGSYKKAVFISDAHLGNGIDDEKREEKLIDFLDKNLNSETLLFIVGDLFDFWFEYKSAVPKGHYKLFARLIDIVKQGSKIYYIAGNHDFWVGSFFEKEIGIVFCPEPLTAELFNKKMYIMHGDGLKKKDWGYRFLKRVFRNRLNIFLYRWLHPDIGIPFAKRMSKTSRDYTSEKDYGSDSEYIDFAKTKFENGFDVVILAHSHKPVSESFEGKYYINSGDWIENFSYILMTEDSIELKYWKS